MPMIFPPVEFKKLFVDSSGWGEEGEPALTAEQFAREASDLVATTHESLYWGVTEAGQFQIYVTAYKREG